MVWPYKPGIDFSEKSNIWKDSKKRSLNDALGELPSRAISCAMSLNGKESEIAPARTLYGLTLARKRLDCSASPCYSPIVPAKGS